MASSGKKGKKGKGKTVSLNDFLSKGGNANGGPDGTTVIMSTPSWADEMDDDDTVMSRSYGNKPEAFVLPTAPRAARGPDMSDDRIPKDPPFTAYIANLSYDVDTEVVMNFFSELRIKGVRLPRDGDAETGRLKGFGYADFEDRASLVEALAMNDHLLQNRKIRVDLATHAGRGTERGGFGDRGGSRYGNRDDDGDDRTAGDWRSGPPPPARDNDRDRGGDRGSDRRSGDRDGSKGFDRYEPPRDRGGFDRDERRDGNRGYGFGREGGDSRSFGGDRNRSEGSRDDRGYERKERGGFDRYERRDDRSRGSPDPAKERPRLNLKPRTDRAESSEDAEGISKSSIFGSAKPVDTAKKEAEIDQKLQESQTRVRTIDLASKRRDEEEKNKSVEKEKDERRDSEKENDGDRPKAERPSIFGGAKPVDTSAREKEIDKRRDSEKENDGDRPKTERPSIFGGAKPVDTSAREKEIDNKRRDSEKENEGDRSKAERPSIFGRAKPVDTSAREKEVDKRRDSEKENDGDKPKAERPSIFGRAKPVDTSAREKEVDKRRDSEKENDGDKPKAERPSIFGSAKPVDTSAREKEIEERLKKQNQGKATLATLRERKDSHHSDATITRDAAPRNTDTQSNISSNRSCDEDEGRKDKLDAKKPASSDIFGSAKPVDTQAREKEIEERMKKTRVDDVNKGRRNISRRDEEDKSNRNRNPRDNDNRGTVGERNYDGKDGGREPQRDDRKYGDRKGIPRDGRPEAKSHGSDESRRDKSPPPMKKIEETKVPNFVGSNKFQLLPDDDEVGSGKESDSE